MTNYLKSNNIIEEKIYIGKIPAIIFRPKKRKKGIPTIIFYHGWSSDKETQRMRGFILAAVGYQVIIPDAVHHGERNPIKEYNIDNATKYFWDTIFTNIKESHIIIDELIFKYNADPNRIGVMGNSMGGFTAAGVFTYNANIKALVVFNGSCGWEISNSLFKRNFELNANEEQKETEEKILKMDPMKNLELLIDRPILLLHGDSDDVVSIESQRIFYKKIKPLYQDLNKIEFIQYPNLNHFVTTNMMEESIAWFYKYL
ncbi:MAG: prolyl oligopeptidase family serine peptidase [Tissierellia bacterium]|nr:prolyl oligopeptidase family serine peptidase [Tissierellia bacterium]